MMTALGRSELLRTYFACPGCGQGGAHVDRLLGLDGFLTRQATRLVCLTGGRVAFAAAGTMLAACCGWTVSDETIRLACEGQSGRIAEFHATLAATAKFSRAIGEVEFQLDGTTVNTTGGWRDMKIGIFARREPGEVASAAEWDSRDLPAPTARVAFAAIEPIEEFAPRLGVWAARLGLSDTAAITTLGDGAAWIWNAAAEQLPGSGGVLDIYHAAEHISDAGKKLFGEKTVEAKTWLEEGRALLLSDGWAGLCDHIGATLTKAPELSGHAALGELTGYFAAHTGRMNYAHRLHTGRSIGSGMVEGAAKNLIGKRMKQTGARWVVGNADAMATLMLPELQRSLGPLLGFIQLNARIRWRTRSGPDRDAGRAPMGPFLHLKQARFEARAA